MDFDTQCMMFTMKEPYYGILLSAMNRIPDPRIGTIAVGKSGNVFKLLYNPNFIGGLKDDTVLELLKHEMLHLAFEHFTIWDGANANDTPAMHKLRNIAEDLEVNCYIDRSKFDASTGGQWCEDFGFERNLGTRCYFQKLLDLNQEQKEKEKDANAPCSGGLGGNNDDEEESPGKSNEEESSEQDNDSSGGSDNADDPAEKSSDEGLSSSFEEMKPMDDHSQWPDEDDCPPEQVKQMIEDILVMAETEVIKNQGEIPAEMTMRLDAIKKKRPRPVTDWKRYFRRHLGNEFTELMRKSKKRESRRFPDAAGNRRKRKSRILVAIDTSGSVSMPEYREFMGQILTLSKSADFHVLECDSRIQHEYDFRGRPNLDLHGGGGTSFLPVIDYFNERRRMYDALVYFTDGCADIPPGTPKDTLWVISSDGNKDRKRYTVNGASAVFIPKQTIQ